MQEAEEKGMVRTTWSEQMQFRRPLERKGCAANAKKCDLGQPSCSRCTRLRIPCVGCGEKRYKFKDGRPGPADTTPQGSLTVPGRASSPAPSQVPGNSLTRETSALVALLRITDLRYDVSGFGGFLKDIPRRMGRNKALDASVNAFTTLYPILYSQNMHVSSAMLAAYVRALESLRISLEDRMTAQTPETLAAIYLVTLSQVSTTYPCPFAGCKITWS